MGIWSALAMVGLGVSVTLASSGCAFEEDDEVELVDESEDAFVERPRSFLYNSSIIEPAMQGPLRVKLVHTAPLTKPWRQWMRTAVDRWFAPMRALPGGGQLTREVVFVTKDEHIILDVQPGGGRASYRVAALVNGPQRIQVFEGDGRGFNVLLHEVGHAIGLGDTYVEGKWVCAAEQPVAVMCASGWDDLRADDIRGAQFEYCQRTKKCSEQRYRDTYGGGGGTRFRSTCPEGHRLAGLDVRQGLVVDSVTPICENIATKARMRLPRIGGSGGERTTTLACPRGAYVTNMSVDHRVVVTGVRLECSDGKLLSDSGLGAGSHDQFRCPSSFPAAVGLRGGAGSFVDRLGLSCDTPDGATFASARHLLGPI